MYKILLVEDDEETAGLVKRGLELEDMIVDVAIDGQDGFEHFQKNEYDLVLLDLEMPRMNGYVNKGSEADLRQLISFIKSKLEPINEDEMKILINGTDMMKAD